MYLPSFEALIKQYSPITGLPASLLQRVVTEAVPEPKVNELMHLFRQEVPIPSLSVFTGNGEILED